MENRRKSVQFRAVPAPDPGTDCPLSPWTRLTNSLSNNEPVFLASGDAVATKVAKKVYWKQLDGELVTKCRQNAEMRVHNDQLTASDHAYDPDRGMRLCDSGLEALVSVVVHGIARSTR